MDEYGQIKDMVAIIRTGMYWRKSPEEIAEVLYKEGYHQASEVASEVFGELEATFYGDGFHYFVAMAVFDALKKKYTEGEK